MPYSIVSSVVFYMSIGYLGHRRKAITTNLITNNVDYIINTIKFVQVFVNDNKIVHRLEETETKSIINSLHTVALKMNKYFM